jgi:large subunit ribosomal protein L25
VLFKIKVRALPKDLPEQIMVDVSHLKIGQAVHLGEIQAPANTEILGDKQIPVISVAAPRTEEEEAAELAAAAEAVPGEVEMIKEKKEEGEEGAPPAGKGAEKGAVKGAEKAPVKGAEKAVPGAEKAAPGAAPKAPVGVEKKTAPAGQKKK